jgi:hypothetical protein
MIVRYNSFAALFLLATTLSGCGQLSGLMNGRGDQPALYTLPQNKRVLVFVDTRSDIAAPAEFATTLADGIGAHLYKYHAANNLVGQDRLTGIRHDAIVFAKMGVGDVAVATDADVILYVDVVTLNIASTTDNSVSQGGAQVLVKVIDRDGKRLWPGTELPGTLVAVQVPAAYTEMSDMAIAAQISDLLTLRIGRMFHKYSLDDKAMVQ